MRKYPKGKDGKPFAYFCFQQSVEERSDDDFHFYTGYDPDHADDIGLPENLCRELRKIFKKEFPDLKIYCNDAESLHSIMTVKTVTDIKRISKQLTKALKEAGWKKMNSY